MKKAVCKYQVEEKENDDSTAFLENILCKAVEESPPQKVCVTLNSTYFFQYIQYRYLHSSERIDKQKTQMGRLSNGYAFCLKGLSII